MVKYTARFTDRFYDVAIAEQHSSLSQQAWPATD